MNFSRSSMRLHSCQGILLSSQKALLCNPCLRNELSPFSQEGHNDLMESMRSNLPKNCNWEEYGNFRERTQICISCSGVFPAVGEWSFQICGAGPGGPFHPMDGVCAQE